MGRVVPDPTLPDPPRAGRTRWLLWLAILSSVTTVVVSSGLITSFYVSAGGQAAAQPAASVPATGAPLTVALARTPGGSSEWRTYAGAIARMGEAAGRPIRVRYVESRSDMSGLLLTGRVDAAFLCTYCYLEVAGQPGVSLVAAPAIAGHENDAAVLIVRGDSKETSLAALKGHRVAVTSPTSLAGHAYLLWLAERDSIDAVGTLLLVAQDSQEESIRALLANKVDAAVVNRSQLAAWSDAGIRVIASSPEFGMPPFVTGATVDDATRERMRAALVSMRPSSGSTRTSIDGFTVPTDDDYDFARTLERYARDPEGSQ